MISRISVSYKLLLIYALDMIAVIFLGYSLAEEKYIAINFARKEVAGTAYIDVARDGMFTVLDYGQAARLGNGGPVKAVLESRLTAIGEAERLYGAEMQSAELAQSAIATSRALTTAQPEKLEQAISEAIASHRALVSRIGDQSNLILDPDLDSYYSMSLVLLRFPELVDLLHQIRSKLHSLKAKGALSADERSELLIVEGYLTNVVRGIQGDRTAGYNGNADGSLEAALSPGFGVLDAALADLLKSLRTTVLDADGGQDRAPVDQAIDATLRATQAVWSQTSTELNRLLDRRIDGFFARMWEHFALAGGLLAVILTLVMMVARRIAVPIRHLAEVAEKVRQTNDYDLRASWNSKDECGQLVDSFNTMLARLQSEAERQRELAAQARASEAQRDLIEAIPTPLTVTRLSDGRLLHVNHPAAALLGDDAGHQLSEADHKRLMEQLQLHGAANEFECECKAAAGGTFWALVSARLLTYQNQQALLTTITPITERKRMEEELRTAKNKAEATLGELKLAQQSLIQAEKMASLGGLVAGVAHEINTPVGIGLTGASTLAAETEKLQKLYAAEEMTQADFEDYLGVAGETARLLMSNMNRAAELIQSFKQVAVDQTSAERRRFDLKTYVDEILTSLHPTLKKHRHEIVVECADGIQVDSFPGILSQVLTNLVMNSLLHAYDEGQSGTLSVTAKSIGDDVELTFADDGKGIPQENLSRIFDPFFTTRRSKGGSGLGLHIVFNVVTSSLNGKVSVQSEPGRGTTFSLRFPRVAPASAQPALV